MSLLFADGCDHLGTADLVRKWDAVEDVQIHAGAGRWSGGAIGSTVATRTGSHSIQKVVNPATPLEGLFGYWLYGDDPSSINTVDVIIQGGGGASDLLTFAYTASTGTIRVYRGHPSAGGTLLGASSVAVLEDNTWAHVEARWRISSSVGEVEVRKNGGVVLFLAGVNTGSSVWNAVLWAPGAGERHDDMWIMDRGGSALNYFIGPKRIYTLNANANGAAADWTGSGAAGYLAVDDATLNSDTDYVYARSAGLVSTFGMADLAGATTGLVGIQLNTLAKRLGTSFPASIRRSFRDTNGIVFGNTETPDTGYRDHRDIWTTMPDGSALTAAGVNAAEFDVERVS